MAHTIPFKLKENAREFAAGESLGFSIRTGIKCKNPSTGEEVWANYECALFAKTDNAINFYRSNLIAGAMAVVSAEKLMPKTFDGQNGLSITLVMLNARMDAVHTGQQYDQAPQPQRPPQNAPQPQQQAQQRPPVNRQPSSYANVPHATAPRQQQPAPPPTGGFDDFDDDGIPFN